MERRLQEGGPGARRTVSGLASGLASMLLLTAGACLVTGNTDLPRPSDVPVVRLIAPPGITYVPFSGDPECGGLLPNPTDPGMVFKANISYPDTQTDTLYVQIGVNGQALDRQWGLQQLFHNADGMPLRVPDQPLCVPHSVLNGACNEVLIVVSGDLQKARSLSGLTDSDTASVKWYVIGSSVDHADATSRDCLPPLVLDGGV